MESKKCKHLVIPGEVYDIRPVPQLSEMEKAADIVVEEYNKAMESTALFAVSEKSQILGHVKFLHTLTGTILSILEFTLDLEKRRQ